MLSADIERCSSSQCPVKDRCSRHVEKSKGWTFWVSELSHNPGSEGCPFFWEETE